MTFGPPKFELARVYDDGSREVEIVPITNLPLDTKMNRREFIGTGITVSTVFSLLACNRKTENSFPYDETIPIQQASVFLSNTCEGVKGHRSSILNLEVSPSSDLLISESDYEIKIWSLSNSNLLKKIPAKKPGEISITPDGKRFFVSFDSNTVLYTLLDGKLVQEFSWQHKGITPDGKYIVCINSENIIDIRNISNGLVLKQLKHEVETGLPEIIITNNTISSLRGLSLYIWSYPSFDLSKKFYLNDVIFGSFKHAMVGGFFIYNQNHVKDKNYIIFFSLKTGNVVKSIRVEEPVSSLATSPDETILVSGHENGVIKVWSLPNGELVKNIKGYEKKITALVFTLDGERVISGCNDGVINVWPFTSKDSPNCLIDYSVMFPHEKSMRYSIRNNLNNEVYYTLRCGSPLPTGAICTCNCISGTFAIPRNNNLPPLSTPTNNNKPPLQANPSSRSYSYCTCNKVCTCIPVCQAHRLLHPDPIVRRLSEQLLLIMGRREFPYMEWAESPAKPALKSRIHNLMQRISNGEKPDSTKWPSVSDCLERLYDPDEIISIMAAQMLNFYQFHNSVDLKKDTKTKVKQMISRASELAWYKNLG